MNAAGPIPGLDLAYDELSLLREVARHTAAERDDGPPASDGRALARIADGLRGLSPGAGLRLVAALDRALAARRQHGPVGGEEALRALAAALSALATADERPGRHGPSALGVAGDMIAPWLVAAAGNRWPRRRAGAWTHMEVAAAVKCGLEAAGVRGVAASAEAVAAGLAKLRRADRKRRRGDS